jgi:hypothetical protein
MTHEHLDCVKIKRRPVAIHESLLQFSRADGPVTISISSYKPAPANKM